jgi:undecaprenyl diphosphate synthase
MVPHHVAIIPDGNRRWATERGLPVWEGHEAGAKAVEALIQAARTMGVTELSLWGSSLENLSKRPAKEIQELLKIYTKHFESILASDEVREGLVRIRILGRFREKFPAKLVALLDTLVEKTKDANQYFLNIFLAYSGDDDMLNAVKTLRESQGVEVTRETLKSALMTAELSPVDYMIRTGGDPHLSTGFLMWDTANAELYFTDRLFPDFSPVALQAALDEFARRARRGGK